MEKLELAAKVGEQLALVYETFPISERIERLESLRSLPTPTSVQMIVASHEGRQEDVMPEFPWPPPPPSAQARIPSSLLKRSEGALLNDLDNQLQTALENAGYQDRKYLRVPAPTGGFVIATNLERYETGGVSSQGQDRWVVSDSTSSRFFDFTAFLRALITGKTGDYRLIVLMVTHQPFGSNPEDRLTHEEARQIMVEGWSGLPRSLANAAWTEDVEVNVLVYEFEKKEGFPPVVRPPRLTGSQHLEASRILASLNPPLPRS